MVSRDKLGTTGEEVALVHQDTQTILAQIKNLLSKLDAGDISSVLAEGSSEHSFMLQRYLESASTYAKSTVSSDMRRSLEWHPKQELTNRQINPCVRHLEDIMANADPPSKVRRQSVFGAAQEHDNQAYVEYYLVHQFDYQAWTYQHARIYHQRAKKQHSVARGTIEPSEALTETASLYQVSSTNMSDT
jgi:hypothetical protein